MGEFKLQAEGARQENGRQEMSREGGKKKHVNTTNRYPSFLFSAVSASLNEALSVCVCLCGDLAAVLFHFYLRAVSVCRGRARTIPPFTLERRQRRPVVEFFTDDLLPWLCRYHGTPAAPASPLPPPGKGEGWVALGRRNGNGKERNGPAVKLFSPLSDFLPRRFFTLLTAQHGRSVNMFFFRKTHVLTTGDARLAVLQEADSVRMEC